MRPSTTHRTKKLVGWIVLGLTLAVAFLLYVRYTHEGIWACVIPASYGFALLLEARREASPRPEPAAKSFRWYHVLLIIGAFAVVYFASSFFSS